MNKVFLTGKMGKDAELKQVKDFIICNVTIATSENVKKGDKWEKQTEWHNITIFGKRGEYIANNATKGTTLAIIGKIKTETWEKNGEKKSKVVIIADEVEIMAGKAVNETKESTFNKELKEKGVKLAADENIPDDDLPF
jgi:single-strand DNA-binding protein